MKASDIPGKFPIPFAANAGGSFKTAIPTTTATPGRASLDVGFPPDTAQPVGSGGIPPAIGDFNGILNEISAWSQWLQSGGAPIVYDSTFQTNIGGYPKGAIVMSPTFPGQIFLSLVDDNATNPNTGGAGWRDLNRSTFQTFKSGSGTYTPSDGVVRIRVRMIAGGGSGACGNPTTSNDGTTSLLGLFTALGGKGGAFASSNDGGNGGQGGFGGVNDPSTNATLIARFAGAPGSPGSNVSNDANIPLGGDGGSSIFGGAGKSISGRAYNQSLNDAKANTGSGGAGAPSRGTSQGNRGGGGAGEYVEFDYVRPASMAYQVGQGGASPTSGDPAAGAGANGIIIIEEKYQ